MNVSCYVIFLLTNSCSFLLQCHLFLYQFPLFFSGFFFSVIHSGSDIPVYHHIHLSSLTSSLRPLSSSPHSSIHASSHLSSFKTCSPVQWGLSSTPLQRALWLSPPHVLSAPPPVLYVQPPVPIRGLCGGKTPWSEPYQQRSLNKQSSVDFHVFGKRPRWWWFWKRSVACYMIKSVSANRGQHCTTAK